MGEKGLRLDVPPVLYIRASRKRVLLRYEKKKKERIRLSSSSSSSPTIEALCARGVFAPQAAELARQAPAELVTAWCEHADKSPTVGPGALVENIRRGKMPPARRSLVDEQREYGEQIVAWLQKHFPELDRPGWGPHPAAVIAVIHLHYRHGKGRLTKRAHGGAIRAAVAAWAKRHGEPEEAGA